MSLLRNAIDSKTFKVKDKHLALFIKIHPQKIRDDGYPGQRYIILLSLLLAIFLLASAFAYPILASYSSKLQPGHERTDISVTIDNSIKPEIPKPPVTEPALPDLKITFRPTVVVDENFESGMLTQNELGTKNTSGVPDPIISDKPATDVPSEKVIETIKPGYQLIIHINTPDDLLSIEFCMDMAYDPGQESSGTGSRIIVL
jgi:hypothetical protein